MSTDRRPPHRTHHPDTPRTGIQRSFRQGTLAARWTRCLLLSLLVSLWLLVPPATAELSLAGTPKMRAGHAERHFCDAPLLGERWVRTELFFGRSKPDGSTVSSQEWQMFLDQKVTPRFPDGLTVLMGMGQFRDDSGTILAEDSVLVILLYPLPGRDSSQKIEQIRKDYKEAFQQQSVLRVDRFTCVSF